MCKEIQVLDHGYIRLVESMGSDLSIVRAARVSHQADWRTGDDSGKDEKLIKYMMDHRHTSPFESVQFTFEVKAPIFVFRQWHRHRTWAYNEISARYSELQEEIYVPDVDTIGVQSKANKQARELVGKADSLPKATETLASMMDHNLKSFKLYRSLLAGGVPRELARTILPLGTYSRMFASVNLHNLFHFLSLRLHQHAQYEIRVYAEALLKLIQPIAPVAVRYFTEGLDK